MLSQASTYAVSALACIANAQGRPVLIKQVARTCRIPAPYLAKIINLLSRKQLVLTQRGVGGGVLLARPPAEITLDEVCVALDDEILRPRCMLGNVACSNDRCCPAHRFCQSARRRLAQFLQRTTVAEIAAFEARQQRRGRTDPRVAAEPPEGAVALPAAAAP